MIAPITVNNPNSTEAVTVGIDEAMALLCMTDSPGIECIMLREGPQAEFGISVVESTQAAPWRSGACGSVESG